jgi:hypothetical protein
MECVADALFLATLNLGNSNVQFKDLADVGATGWYIPSPWACRGRTMSSRTLYGCIVYITNAWVSLCLVYCTGFPRT